MEELSKEWEDEETNLLIELYKNKLSYSDISKMFPDRTYSAIATRINRLGLAKKYPRTNDYILPEKHTKEGIKLYSIYYNIKDRCYNPKCHAYKDYGERGIRLCDEWNNDSIEGFRAFYNWAMNNGYEIGLSIDRIDNDGIYSPENCQWITKSENTAKANRINARRKSSKGEYYGIDPEGKFYRFDNAAQFAREHNLNGDKIRNLAHGNIKTYDNWQFGFINEVKDELFSAC